MPATLYATNPLSGTAWSATKSHTSQPAAGSLGVAIGTYQLLANPTAGDVIRFCRLPAGAMVIGGTIYGQDIDSGSGLLNIGIGREANGAESASSSGLGGGQMGGAVVPEIVPAAAIWRPLQGTLLANGFQKFTFETWISGTVVAAANVFAAGRLTVVVQYIVA
jgi:hypothetical protein